MHRRPRRLDEPLLSGFLVWRVALVSALFLAGIFGMFAWSRSSGLSLEEARTAAVNTLVVMEIFYLFSVRYWTDRDGWFPSARSSIISAGCAKGSSSRTRSPTAPA